MQINYGDIFQLGRHRLMCGDATNINDLNALIQNDVVNLVLTDPPYGMKCQDKNGCVGRYYVRKLPTGGRNPYGKSITPLKHMQMIGDNTQQTAKNFYENIKDNNAIKIFWGGQYFAHFLPVSGGWIFWDKQTGSNDFSDGELAWCSKGRKIKKYTQLWNGILRAGNYILNPKPRIHPTQKPVELHAKILEDYSKPDDIILDAFGGSGTTLIACEVTNRTCLMMEISPQYCEIILQRFKDLTMEEPIKIYSSHERKVKTVKTIKHVKEFLFDDDGEISQVNERDTPTEEDIRDFEESERLDAELEAQEYEMQEAFRLEEEMQHDLEVMKAKGQI